MSNSCGNTATEISNSQQQRRHISASGFGIGIELDWFSVSSYFFFDFGLGFWGGLGSGFCLGPRLRSFENTRTRVLRAKCELESEQRPFSAAPTSRNRSNLFEYFN